MILSLIAAIGENRELGKDGKLLWYLPDDFAYFKKVTTGHPVIMGRKTFEAIGKPLPNRENVVITGDRDYAKEGITVVHSVPEALALFDNQDKEVFVIGGAQVYAQALPQASNLYLTHVEGSFEADTYFPEYIDDGWDKVWEERHDKDDRHNFSFTFTKYEKKRN